MNPLRWLKSEANGKITSPLKFYRSLTLEGSTVTTAESQNARVLPVLSSVALVSSGISHIRRGYESYMADLYQNLSQLGSVHLLQGSPPVDLSNDPNRHTLTCLKRTGFLAKTLYSNENKRYWLEQASFALSGLLSSQFQRFKILHCSDPTLARYLMKVKKQFGFQYQVLFSNSGPMHPEDCLIFDHIQEFTPAYLEAGRSAGIRVDQSTLIPMGIALSDYQTGQSKENLRQQWQLPANAPIVISIASLDEPFKRLPVLIEALAQYRQVQPKEKQPYLLLVGQNQQTDTAKQTLQLAAEKLGSDFQHLSVSHHDIPKLLQASDLFILPSLQEGFGRVYLEAMASGIPVLCHNNPHTQWIVSSPESRIDMTHPDQLCEAIARCLTQPQEQMIQQNLTGLKATFDQNLINQQLINLYQRLLTHSGGAY